MPTIPRPDPGRAILSLLLALALWTSVQNEQNPDRVGEPGITVPVEIKNIPPGLMATGEEPSVRVRVRAPSDVWNRLRQGSFRSWVDASRAGPGVAELPVSIESLEPSVRSVEPDPPRIAIRLEEVRERQLPVKVDILGNVPFGYSYKAVSVRPEEVTISGAASMVDRVEAAVIELRLDGVTVNVNETRVPRLLDARGGEVRGVRLTPPTVSLQVEVIQQVAYKQVGIRPIIVGKVAAGYIIEPIQVEPASVTVVGDPKALADINFIETDAVDVNGAASSFTRRVGLVVPEGVSLLQPQAAVVDVRVSPLIVSQTVRLMPTVTGLGSNLQVNGQLPEVEVTVSGPSPIMRELTPREFRAVLDLSGLGAGRHSVRPRLVVPTGLAVDGVDPDTVVVTLQEYTQPPAASPSPVGTVLPSTPTPAPAGIPPAGPTPTR